MNKHIILTNGRSGSNYLVDVINQHPALFNYGEVLGDWSKKRKVKNILRIDSEERYLETIFNSKFFYYFTQLFFRLKYKKLRKVKRLGSLHSIGFKDFGINFQRRHLETWLIESDDIKIINLYRENQLDRYISLFAMKKTGVVANTSASVATKIYIDTSDLIKTLEVYEEELNFQLAIASSMNDDRVFNVAYETLFGQEDKSAIFESMWKFLQVSNIKIEDRHKPILATNLSEKIENFDDVVECLHNTPFEKYLG